MGTGRFRRGGTGQAPAAEARPSEGCECQIEFVPKVKVEVLVSPEDVEKVIDTIADAARTSKIGDGKIWAIEVDRAMRLRTGELGLDVL